VRGVRNGWFSSAAVGPTDAAVVPARPVEDALVVVPRFVSTGLAAGEVGPLALISIAGAVSPEAFEAAFHALAPLRANRPQYVTLYLFRPRVPLPDDATRRKVRELLASGQTAAHACAVLDAEGFWVAAARGVLASLALVTPRAPMAVRSLDEALAWAQTRLGAGADVVTGLGPLVAAFRAQHWAGTLRSPS
jgi:hypothetical protein